MKARKEAERRRKERMGTVTLSKFSGDRASETGVGGGVLGGGFGLILPPPRLKILDPGPTGQAGSGRQEMVRWCCKGGVFVSESQNNPNRLYTNPNCYVVQDSINNTYDTIVL